MLRFYETVDNLGSAFVNTLLFTKPVNMISSPSAQFDIISGYTNKDNAAGQLIITNNDMSFSSGDSITPSIIGEYVLFSLDKAQQIVVDVTDVVTITTITLDFTLEPIVNDLFDAISTQLAIDGGDRYRCIAIQNDDPLLSFQSGKIWILNQVSEGLASIGLDPTGVNGTPTSSDGITVPAGVSFFSPVLEFNGIIVPTLNPGDHVFLWFKRTSLAQATKDTFRLTLDASGSYV